MSSKTETIHGGGAVSNGIQIKEVSGPDSLSGTVPSPRVSPDRMDGQSTSATLPVDARVDRLPDASSSLLGGSPDANHAGANTRALPGMVNTNLSSGISETRHPLVSHAPRGLDTQHSVTPPSSSSPTSIQVDGAQARTVSALIVNHSPRQAEGVTSTSRIEEPLQRADVPIIGTPTTTARIHRLGEIKEPAAVIDRPSIASQTRVLHNEGAPIVEAAGQQSVHAFSSESQTDGQNNSQITSGTSPKEVHIPETATSGAGDGDNGGDGSPRAAGAVGPDDIPQPREHPEEVSLTADGDQVLSVNAVPHTAGATGMVGTTDVVNGAEIPVVSLAYSAEETQVANGVPVASSLTDDIAVADTTDVSTAAQRSDVASPIPSWRATAEVLTLPQRQTAERVAFGGVVLAGLAAARSVPSGELHGLSGSEKKAKKKDLRVKGAVRFVNSHIDTATSPVTVIEENKDRVFSRAQDWTEKDMAREETRLRRMMRQLPPELQEIMAENTGLQPETRDQKVTRIVRNGVINLGYQIGREWVYQVAGGAAAVADPIARLHWSIGGTLGGSYGIWAAGLGVGMYENWQRLEQEGNSPSLPSLLEYERARIVAPDSKWKQVLRTARGYLYWDAGNEALYYLLAALGLAATQSDTRVAAYLAAANVAAGGTELTQAGVSKFLRTPTGKRLGEHVKAPIRAARTVFGGKSRNAETGPELTVVPDSEGTVFGASASSTLPDGPTVLHQQSA